MYLQWAQAQATSSTTLSKNMNFNSPRFFTVYGCINASKFSLAYVSRCLLQLARDEF